MERGGFFRGKITRHERERECYLGTAASFAPSPRELALKFNELCREERVNRTRDGLDGGSGGPAGFLPGLRAASFRIYSSSRAGSVVVSRTSSRRRSLFSQFYRSTSSGRAAPRRAIYRRRGKRPRANLYRAVVTRASAQYANMFAPSRDLCAARARARSTAAHPRKQRHDEIRLRVWRIRRGARRREKEIVFGSFGTRPTNFCSARTKGELGGGRAGHGQRERGDTFVPFGGPVSRLDVT